MCGNGGVYLRYGRAARPAGKRRAAERNKNNRKRGNKRVRYLGKPLQLHGECDRMGVRKAHALVRRDNVQVRGGRYPHGKNGKRHGA